MTYDHGEDDAAACCCTRSDPSARVGCPQHAKLMTLDHELAEACYSINRALTTIRDNMERASHWSEAERRDYERLQASRDHIWSMRQSIDPTLKD